MYKFLRIFSLAISMLVVCGATPFAKKADVHNKAPGIEQTILKMDVVSNLEVAQQIAPMEYDVGLQLPDEPAIQHPILNQDAENKIKDFFSSPALTEVHTITDLQTLRESN